MIRNITFLVFFLLVHVCSGQVSTPVFNITYSPQYQYLNQSASVIEFDSLYIANEKEQYVPSWEFKYGFRVVDSIGNVVKHSLYSLDTNVIGVYSGLQMFKTHDNNILDTRVLLYLDSSNATNPFKNVFLIKATLYGDTLWTKEISDSVARKVDYRSTLQLSDSSLICAGYDGSQNKANPIFIKLDRHGNLLKTKRINTSHNDYVFGCVSHANGNLYATGTSNSHTNGGSYHQMMMCLDTSLELKWIKRFGPQSFYSGKPAELSTGEILIPIGEITGEENGLIMERKAFLKVDTNGNVVWSKHYGYANHVTRFENVLELADSSWVVLGRNREHQNPFKQGVWHSLMKLSPEGDSLWEVEMLHTGYNGRDKLFGLYNTNDNGFVMSGSSIVNGQASTWITKVDSTGIGLFTADTIPRTPPSTGSDLTAQSAPYRISPNPSDGEVWISWTEESQAPAALVLYNMQGQQVWHTEAPKNGQKTKLNVPKGAYILAFKDHLKATLSRQRVVVE